MCDLYVVGEILRPHGNRGEVAVRPLTDHLPTLLDAQRIFLGTTPENPVRILGTRIHKGVPLIMIEGIDNIDRAQELRGMMLCLPRDELLPLQEGEFFLHDLIGLIVLDHRRETVGKVDRILETAGAPLLAGTRMNGGSFMIPFASGTIEEANLEKGTIILADLPGLVDERDRV